VRKLMPFLIAALVIAGAPASADTETRLLEEAAIADLRMTPDSRWRFFTDQVMGGVSTGGVTFAQEDGTPFARMTGRVSTANRGGFIQMRLDLSTPPPEGTTGIRLVVRGNDQRYFVHLRTGDTVLPWQYYQAGFEVTEGWTEIRLPFEAFAPSGALLRRVPRPASLTSVAIVAYGRDHDARIDVRVVGLY
jgi:hypothetical protein